MVEAREKERKKKEDNFRQCRVSTDRVGESTFSRIDFCGKKKRCFDKIGKKKIDSRRCRVLSHLSEPTGNL